MNVNGVQIVENVQTTDGDGDVEMEPGTVETRNIRSINAMDIDTRDGTKSLFSPIKWIVNAERTFVSGVNTLYNSFTSQFKVPKYDAYYLITTLSGQLISKDCELILQAIDENLFATVTNSHGGSFLWTNKERNRSVATRSAIGVALGALLDTVGTIVVNRVKELITVQVGGRYALSEPGYWFIKNDRGINYIFNEYADPENPLLVELAPGDCYFYFGAEADLSQIGFSDLKCSFTFDKNFVLCFGGLFGDWQITPSQVVDSVLDLTKRACITITDTIYNFYSQITGWLANRELETDDGLPHYPGLICVERYDKDDDNSNSTITTKKSGGVVKDKSLFNKTN